MRTESKDFTNDFKGILKEVLAMKQAHKYGLNRTDFSCLFIKELQSKRVIHYRLTITLDTNVVAEPYIDLSSSEIESITTLVWDGVSKTFTFTGQYASNIPGSVYYTAISVISTQPISSYTWEEI